MILGAITLWAFSSFLVVRFLFDINGRATMPTESFLKSGAGKVLDMGAGTGRSTLMVLEARPQTDHDCCPRQFQRLVCEAFRE